MFTTLIHAEIMRSTNNSMETLLHDQAPEYQQDDKCHLSRKALPTKPCNRMTFEDKPSPPPSQIARANNSFRQFRHSHRTFWIVIQDIEATRKSHKHENYKHRDAKASIKALNSLIHQYNLQNKGRTGVICQPSGESLRKTLQTIFARHNSEVVPPSKTVWLASKRDWDAKYLRMIEDACTEVTLEESLTVYDPARAQPFDTDAGGHEKKKGSHSGKAGANVDKQTNELAGAEEPGDPETQIGQPALDSITVSSRVVISTPTQSPAPKPQRSCRKNSPKVRLTTRLMIIKANIIHNSRARLDLLIKVVLIKIWTLPMPLKPRNQTRKARVRSAKLPRPLHQQAAAAVKSQNLLTLTNSN